MSAKPVKRLIREPGIWRVDGYGYLKIYDRYTPQIFVSMSQIKPEGIDSCLYKGQTTGKQIWVRQPLNRISDLLIGSCWSGGEDGKGKRINKLSPIAKTFTVDTSKTKIVKLDEPIELKGIPFETALPRSAIKLGKNWHKMNQSLYAIVPVLDDDRTDFLVISCVELYRAYLGVSSGFTNNLALNNLSQYMTWNEPTLKVYRKLSKLEQFVAYRGHESAEGLRSWNMPSNHLKAIKLANNGRDNENQLPLTIRSIFPFEGRTTLTVAGKAFKNENTNGFVWCVFAANLLHCSKEVLFEPTIEADRSSANTPLPWQENSSDTPSTSDDPFEDEEEDIDATPNTKGKNIAFIDSNNFFEAMRGLKIKRVDSDESTNPVYDNNIGEALISAPGEGPDSDIPVLDNEDYDSHVDHVARDLETFIQMVKQLRLLFGKRGWTVSTRSCGSTIIVEDEVITTFKRRLNEGRKSWHLIDKGTENEHLRQIVWVEICLSEDQFIYLVEMELNESEKSRSSQLIKPYNYSYMPEKDFDRLLAMTKANNRWPKENHKWKSDKAEKAAKIYFQQYHHIGVSHPNELSDNERSTEYIVKKWAGSMESKVLQELSLI